jgi:hypothetical protein
MALAIFPADFITGTSSLPRHKWAIATFVTLSPKLNKAAIAVQVKKQYLLWSIHFFSFNLGIRLFKIKSR